MIEKRVLPIRLGMLFVVVSCLAAALWSHRVVGGSGDIAAAGVPASPGGNLSVESPFVDDASGRGPFEVIFTASEKTNSVGKGDAFLYLKGPGLTACDVHGPAAEPNLVPLPAVVCGGSHGMSVAIDGCRAKVALHGYVHSDHPHITFIGLTCIDLVVEKLDRSYEIEITIYTPKGPIVLSGTLTGSVAMDTCPDHR